MDRSFTIVQQIAAGAVLPIVALLVLSGTSYQSVRSLARASALVTHSHEVIRGIGDLVSTLKDAETGQRGFVITGDSGFLGPYLAAVATADKKADRLRQLSTGSPQQLQRLSTLRALAREKLAELGEIIELRRQQGFEPAMRIIAEGRGQRAMDEIRRLARAMTEAEEELLRQRGQDAQSAARLFTLVLLGGTLVLAGLKAGVAALVIRGLEQRIGTAVQHIRSSSAQLQASAMQQVRGAKEQAAIATEVEATMHEMVASSRQIADGAQRVSGLAGESTGAARTGAHTVEAAQGALGTVKQQVERIVAHMLELGQRSQQIGAILDLINELADQTNILSINATIEAVGAGEAGRRFAVVADEVRKLADRVAGSTKEIRGLVAEVRAAATTTVTATEDGSKAVAASTQRFGEVAASFKCIVDYLISTTQASRDIGLSTRMQTTAVEQTCEAIASVARTAREAEASSVQTLQTASQLTQLSQQLLRLIQRQGTL